MLSKWPIRNKLLVGIGLLLVIVATLSWSGFHGVYAYRSLVKCLSGRATELPLAARLSQEVSDLRAAVSEVHGLREAAASGEVSDPTGASQLGQRFSKSLGQVAITLKAYRGELQGNDRDSNLPISDSHQELQTMGQIDRAMSQIDQVTRDQAWVSRVEDVDAISRDLEQLQHLVGKLPSYLHERIIELAGGVRMQYHTLIGLTWVTTLSAAAMLGLLLRLFYNWVFWPLRVLVEGSRLVAAGEFNYRISLDTQDEMAELAEALNDMTARFQAIRDDLDRQVQERTKQVVRSEQLASVGFLAAGVAHEINNPLASIALCAESLEGRIQEVLDSSGPASDQHEVIRNYLRMIQSEAFRCKGITERLLDFSRLGEVQRQNADLGELVQGVIHMVSHLGRYQDKRIEFAPRQSLIAPVNAQEIKQVVLNLLTNGLDSLSQGGVLRIELAQRGQQAEIIFTDNGCGMTDEVRQHLFEPFFTRRRTGQGIGLGLSITYRIVADHGGHIDVHSEGPGKGSQFRILLPLTDQQKESEHRYQAA